MYKAAVNFLRGQVLVHIESGCPERVVNLCAGAEVPFWDVQWLSPVELTLRTTRRGLAQVRRAAEQVGAAATVRRARTRSTTCTRATQPRTFTASHTTSSSSSSTWLRMSFWSMSRLRVPMVMP